MFVWGAENSMEILLTMFLFAMNRFKNERFRQQHYGNGDDH